MVVRGGGVGKELAPDLVEGEEVVQVRVEHLRLDDTIQRRAGRLERPRQTFEDITRLALDLRAVVRKRRIDTRLLRDAGLEVAGQLAGREHEIAHDDCFGVARQRPRATRWHDARARPRHRGGQVDLDETSGDQEPARADRRPRRRRRKVLTPDLVEPAEVPEVGEEDLRLHDVAQRRPGGLECPLQIVQHVARLLLDRRAVVGKRRVETRLGRHSLLEVTRKMAGREHEVARARGRGVAGQRLRDAGHRNVDPWQLRSPLAARCSADERRP